MVGTGEIKYPGWTKTSTAARQFDIELSIKYPGWTKTSTAARQFDIELSRARGRKP